MMNLKSIVSQKISAKNFIIGIIWVLLLIVMLCIFPGGMITKPMVSNSVADDNSKTGAITPDLPIIQQFVPQHKELRSIGFTLDRNRGTVTEGTVIFKVFDAAIQLLSETRIPMNEVEDGNFTDIELGLEVDTAMPYYFRIETEGVVENAAPVLAYRSLSGCGPAENQTLYYGSTVLEDSAAVCRYEYDTPLGIAEIITYGVFLTLLGAVAAFFVNCLSETKRGGFLKKEHEASVCAGYAGSLAGAALLCMAGYFLIAADIFKTDRLDKGVYFIGLLFAAFIWIYFMRKGLPAAVIAVRELLKKKNRLSGVRALLFAVICLLGMYYFNSGSNKGHDIATAFMLICFVGILLTLREFRTIFSRGKEKRRERLSLFYSIVLFAFFGLLIIFANGREWVYTVVIPFGVLYLLDLDKEKWERLLREFCGGAVLSFFVILCMSLLVRPYHRYNYSRYPLMFYSVATCSLYLIVVVVAALTIYFAGIKKRGGLKGNIGNLLMLGTTSCYLFMTVSRTAMLAVGVTGIGAVILLGFTWYKGNIKRLVVQCLAIFGAVLFIFPIAFTATRSIPAIVGRPFIMGGELWEETITAEDEMDSPKYMNMERFLELNFDKIIKSFTKDTVKQAEGGEELLYASARTLPPAALYAKGVTAETWYNESEGTFGNGRLDIYMAYLRNLNFTGHDDMLLEENDMIYYHAHNTFLQSAYDHGIFVGIYFLILGIISFIRSIYYFKERNENSGYALLPFLIMIAFGMASLTEWTFHPSILIGFAVLLVQAPLLRKVRKNEKEIF